MEFKKHFLSVDGNTAAALGSYIFTEVAAIFPITPSSPMAEAAEAYAGQGKVNVFGNKVDVVELQAEGGAAGAVHGALQGGALSTTYTASQGLLLMLPNIYKWVGEELPAVMHVAARSLASRALSIFGDHEDVYACRQTGAAMMCANSVQEVADLAPVAHLIAIEASAPVINFFDGFRTSHEIQNVEFVEDAGWKSLLNMDAVKAFKAKAMNPHGHAITRGGAENDDICFQGLEAQNMHNANIVDVAEKYFAAASELTGRSYAPFMYVGAPDATKIIVAMGSVCETANEVVDKLVAEGEKVGLVKVHLYRPFSAKLLAKAIPASVKKIAILDRTKEPGSAGEPLYVDVLTSLSQEKRKMDVIVGGRYGLSSKDTQPKHVKAVFDFLDAKKNWTSFTVGINDDVTHLSIPVDDEFVVENNVKACLFYGLGSDGTVSANKSSCKIFGDATHQYAQAYFAYDSRKSGGTTRSNLRFGKDPIHSTYYVTRADFLSCSLDSYIYQFDMLKNLKNCGTFLLNTDMTPEKLIAAMPNKMKHDLAAKNAKFYIIDANKLASSLGMGRHTNTILQASFFKLSNIMDYAEAQEWMKKFAKKSYASKGDDMVEMNYKAIDAGAEGLVEVAVDPEWIKLSGKRERKVTGDDYYDQYMTVIGQLDGYDLPVSTFKKWELEDGSMENNMAFKEKRSIADRVPLWHRENCIQCNLCAMSCPHATIRTFMLTDEEIKCLPESEQDDVLPAMGGKKVEGLKFRIQVSPRNCVGCGICMLNCPGKRVKQEDGTFKQFKALEMVEAKSQFDREPAADYLYKELEPKKDLFSTDTIKGAAMLKPYQEVCGACAGCGEAPYYRLASQLFGRDMLIANATGCSSIYNASTPLSPFVKDKNGEGIAWANSLFEDNAEYGYGMRVATDHKLGQVLTIIEANKKDCEADLQAVLEEYEANVKNRELVRGLLPNLLKLVKASKNEGIKDLLELKNDILDKSVWIIGGDGWAYDIGYGGLDHVIAQERDVNILVLDTEVYSNTGGQASKATQTGAIAQFASTGKIEAKKNMALIAMAYEHVYVAQVSLAGNQTQTIKAMKEAESYNGPSIILAYSPCLLHHIKGGLGNSQKLQKEAVECGYYPIFRYDPRRIEEGKDPLVMDCKEPDWTKFRDFLLKQARYSQLPKVNPEHAEELFAKCEYYAKRRLAGVIKMGKLD